MATWQLARKKQVVQLPWGLSDTKVIVDFLSAYHSIYAWPLCFSPFFPSPFSSFLLWSLFFSCLIRSNVFSNSFRFSKGCQIWPPLWNYNSNAERQEATSRIIWLHCMKISSNCLIYLSRQYSTCRVRNSNGTKWHTLRISLSMTPRVQAPGRGPPKTRFLRIFAEIAHAYLSMFLYLLSPILFTQLAAFHTHYSVPHSFTQYILATLLQHLELPHDFS